MESPTFSVVIPVHNEEQALPEVLQELRGVLDQLEGESWECVVVDDGSTDASPGIVARLAESDPRFRLVRFAARAGQTAAFDAGIRAARGELIGTMDGDGQNDPKDFAAQIERLRRDNLDVVCGVRQRRRDSVVRRISSRLANGVRNWATRETVADVGCSIRVFRRARALQVKLFNGLHRFLPTLFRLEGCSIAEIPVNHRPRAKGKSKYGVNNRLWRGIRDLFAVRWMMSRALRYRIVEHKD